MQNFCPACGTWYQYENSVLCPNCGLSLKKLTSYESKKIRDPFFAILFSFFFVGWGQWYNGKNLSGLKLFGGFLFFFISMIYFAIMTSIQIFADVFLVLMIGIWLYGMYDANKTAKQINQNIESFIGKGNLFWLPVVLLCLLISAGLVAFIFWNNSLILY